MARNANAAGTIRLTWGRILGIPRSVSAAARRLRKSREANREAAPKSRWRVRFMIVPRRLRWLWLTLAVVFLDRATKAWIESRPEEYFPHTVIQGFLDIIRSHNPGIAFSFFADSSSSAMRYVLIFGSVAIIGIIAWLLVGSR